MAILWGGFAVLCAILWCGFVGWFCGALCHFVVRFCGVVFVVLCAIFADGTAKSTRKIKPCER
ncbi:hypothetical protein [Campylobacter sp.]|uniref:hypothetical protein n=1 Tax=Campylobacter sp. TaxID=205 RepID=UPI002AA78908|nr:hypothetical protein [Campylobacter sp.]